MAALHGEPVTPKSIGTSLLINGVFNGLGTVLTPKKLTKKPKANVLKNPSVSIPAEVDDVIKYAQSHNGAAQPGFKGNRVYKNEPIEPWHQKLPDGTTYKEYDIYPNVKGQNRGGHRVVIGADGSIWYTNDHYITFTRIK